VELGLAPPREWDSWQAGGCCCLIPGWCLSQQGREVIPHRAGAGQVLMGGVGSHHPRHGWGSAGPEGQWALGRAGIRVSCGTRSGSMAKGQIFLCGVGLGDVGWSD
jgi:hypothetical protein